MTLLQFSVEGLSCAITVGKTVFVERMVRITPQTGGESGIAGVINLHGRTVPVYQVRTLLGFPDRRPRLSDVLIVTKAGSDCIALWVDETSGISPDTTLAAEDASVRAGEPVVQGVSITAEGLVIIRDLAGFLKNRDPHQLAAALHTRKIIPREESQHEEAGRVDTVLSERAQKLSQPAARSKGIVRIEVLKFRLAYQEYAIGMKFIREVVLTGGITPVPGTPEYISGICAIRGEIISLVDLRALFSISGRGLTDLNRVIVVTDGSMTFGILADYITGIATIPASMPAAPAPVPSAGEVPYLLGVVDGIVVLDGAALLTDPRMLIDETAA
ncbi:MAG: chemotaxis protein CheW [Methanoregula sp.]|nr:chemotaxis protein CheW [Methanoregula sp.]